MKEYFSFCHDYYKLQWASFTTIRGKSAAKQYEIDQVVEIRRVDQVPSNGTGRVLFKAEVVGIEVVRLADIPLPVMQRDAEYKGYRVLCPLGFMGLLNSFRKWEKSKLKSLDDEVTIFYLWRI
jgi:hypothetical protein